MDSKQITISQDEYNTLKKYDNIINLLMVNLDLERNTCLSNSKSDSKYYHPTIEEQEFFKGKAEAYREILEWLHEMKNNPDDFMTLTAGQVKDRMIAKFSKSGPLEQDELNEIFLENYSK